MEDLLRALPVDSWFRDFMDVWPTAEPPRSYILFSSLAMLGVALGRKVHFDLDVHTVYPLMNLLLIGPSGIGKSTALVDISLENLIRPLPSELAVNVITGKSTKEALHEDIHNSPHSVIVASELANFFSKEKYQEGMIPYMTDLLDLRPTSVRTKSGGPGKVIQKPEVAVMGGSTKAWLQDMLPNSSGEGGFLPRFLIVKEDYKFQRIADPKRFLSQREFEALSIERQRVFYEFVKILRMAEGKIDFEDNAASDTYGMWYQTFMPETGNLAPFAARAGAHVLRIALLLAVSCKRDKISERHVKGGIELYNYTQKKLQEVVVPMTPQGRMLSKVLECIGDDFKSDIEIRRAMRNYCGASDVDRMINSLLMSRDIAEVEGKFRRVN